MRPGGPRRAVTTTCFPGCDAIIRPRTLDGNEHVWHLYTVRVPDGIECSSELHAAGIGVGIHYPVPIHLTPAFAGLGYARARFPSWSAPPESC